MKKFGMLTVIVMLMAVVTAAQAEVRAGSVTVTPFIGGYHFEGNEDYQDLNAVTFGLRAGYNFTKHWGAEGYFNFVQANANVYPITNNDDVNIGAYGIEGLYHFMPESHFVPFLAVGIGGIHYQNPAGIEDQHKLSVDYGAGLKLFLPDSFAKFFLADDVALRADVRHILPLNDRYNDFLYTAGIAFSFGGKKKAVEPPPPPMDSDGDGVPDDRDKCPNTPRGCIVDDDGCPIDSDHDGVPDCMDKCPNTPQGCIVDKDGCPIDSDHDGVPDCMDKCPNTPAGAIVDKDGCMHEKVTIRLDVEFDTAKWDVKEKYRDEIRKVADFMKEHPKSIASIDGHTDNVGKAPYNLGLSKNRANSVRQYLINNFGIKASRLTATGYGLTRPIASNDTEEGRQKNRRVEAVLEAIDIK
jgi:OOP family OmpA-OmpF porin